MGMRMSTLASFQGHEIWRDMNGSILMDGIPYDSAMDAAWHAPDEIRREMIKQVFDTQLNYIDGPAAYDAAQKQLDEDGCKMDSSANIDEGTHTSDGGDTIDA